MGKALDGTGLARVWQRIKGTVVDNLLSTSTDLPLSANQGRVLSSKQSLVGQYYAVENEVVLSAGSNEVQTASLSLPKGVYVITYTIYKWGSGVKMWLRAYLRDETSGAWLATQSEDDPNSQGFHGQSCSAIVNLTQDSIISSRVSSSSAYTFTQRLKAVRIA